MPHPQPCPLASHAMSWALGTPWTWLCAARLELTCMTGQSGLKVICRDDLMAVCDALSIHPEPCTLREALPIHIPICDLAISS